eukprot:GHRR01009564.1.p1 GENE.GHRR01009564.1~~GHRR01009564.1.p1  ORF type:complete len:808 (+),score=362.19 GHRR01009564.1:218-2641(+)
MINYALRQVSESTSSVGSDGGPEQSIRQHLPPRRNYSSVDVDTAKQAAMSALAGLDMTTTKANLDASKAAAATARANGEAPAHTRKSNLRSVSCRQLGTGSTSTTSSIAGSSSTPPAGKSVAFDEAAKVRAAGDAARVGQFRTAGMADGQQRKTTRAPASRCVSLPHVLQGRAGMANRLAASYVQDATFKQQLQLLNSGTLPPAYASINQVQHGLGQVDAMLYQLQNQLGASGTALLAQQRGFGAGTASMDDSVLPLRSGTMLMPQGQQQQLQVQQARLAGSWAAGGQPQLQGWNAGQLSQQGMSSASNAAAALAQVHNAQLLAQLQANSLGQAGGDVWKTAASSAALPLSNGRSQGIMLSPQAAAVSVGMPGIPGLEAQQLVAASAAPASGSAAATPAPTGQALLDNYQSASWSVLAAAQSEAGLRDQLLTELVLLLTMLHTLAGLSKGSMTLQDAMNDLSYLATAARRHLATFSRLSQAGNCAVQLLALITPLACMHLSSAELFESAFLVLDTLALANRDAANLVAQQRLAAAASLMVQVPVEQLLQQQRLCLHWINSLSTAVNRNKALLEGMGGADAGSQGAGLLQNAAMGAGNLAGVGMGLPASQPMTLPAAGAPNGLNGATLSPNNKTPLATYFEETAPAGAVPSGLPSVPGLRAAPAGTNGAGLVLPGGIGMGNAAAATPGGPRLSDTQFQDTLGCVRLSTVPVQEDTSPANPAGTTGSRLGIAELQKLANLSLNVAPTQLTPVSAAAGANTMLATGINLAGNFGALGGNMSLFASGTLLGPQHSGGSGPNSATAPHMVGV